MHVERERQRSVIENTCTVVLYRCIKQGKEKRQKTKVDRVKEIKYTKGLCMHLQYMQSGGGKTRNGKKSCKINNNVMSAVYGIDNVRTCVYINKREISM